jgi:branched-chain amino acid transport system ATP-binding protein
MTALLLLEGVSRRFGGLKALDNVSIAVAPGEILGLIGPNGAGKTTLINVVTGTQPATGGTVRFEDHDITREKPYAIARRGLARTFQIVQPFPRLTVLDNVAAGALFAGGAANLKEARIQAKERLQFTGLAQIAEHSAATLTLAQRKRLEVAKALAMKPKLVLFDEVNAGLNLSEIHDALAMIRRIAEAGIAIVVIEHVMKVVRSISHRVIVLHHGQLIADGKPDAVLRDQAVIEAYLGSRYATAIAGTAT